jgi:hypothetical protein
MKNISTGFGLCVLGLGIAAWPVLDRLMPTANASAVTAAVAVSTAATGQTTPTIVWYGLSSSGSSSIGTVPGILFRAWSDGRIEYRLFGNCYNCSTSQQFTDHNLQSGPWRLFSDPAQGLTYRSDINFDEKVDGADLGQLLTDWGNAPRQDIPPSDCPLALINP